MHQDRPFVGQKRSKEQQQKDNQSQKQDPEVEPEKKKYQVLHQGNIIEKNEEQIQDFSRFMIAPQRCTNSALTFKILKQWKKCRVGLMTLPHGPVRTPVYMPVGTKGAMKGVLESTLSNPDMIDCDIMLCNTYHLMLKPGEEILKKMGGQHKFMARDNNLLTDSGGFQIVSLGALNTLNEEGVKFKSHIDGVEFNLTPERSMEVQNTIGADIMMQLDDVVPPTVDDKRVLEAMYRSIRWLDRCIVAHKNTDTQNLFCIIQGGTDDGMRDICCREMIKRNTPGFAIGGMAGGEDKEDFWKTVAKCCDMLPPDKPRYVMGIGYAEDCMISAILGADMFDCVFATRTARFGNAFTKYGLIKVKHASHSNDFGPLSEGCTCYTCKNYSKAYIQNLMKKDSSAIQLISIHNIHFLIENLRQLRQAVLDDNAEQVAIEFFTNYFKKEGVPQWIKNALKSCDIDI